MSLKAVSITMNDIFDIIKRNETSKFYKSMRHHPEYVNFKDEFGNTPLMTSCVLGKNQYVSALLRFKSDPLITNRVGVNSLALASYSGSYDSVCRLLDSRSYMMYQNSIVPPLCAAVMSGSLEIVKIFSTLNPGPDKIKTLQGVTPLQLSVLYNHPIITEYFHKCGLSDTRNAFYQKSIDIQNFLTLNMDISILITPTMSEENVFKYPEPVKSGTNKLTKRKLTVDKRRSFSPYQNSTRFAFKELSPNISPIQSISGPNKIEKPEFMKPTASNPRKKMPISPKVVIRTPMNKKNVSQLTIDMDRRLSIESVLIDIGMEKYINVFQKEEIDLEVFLTMDNTDLCKIGIEHESDREKLFDAIKQF